MGNVVKVKKADFSAVARQLKKLGGKVAKDIAYQSTYAGAKTLQEAIKANAPEKTGRLKNAIQLSAQGAKQGLSADFAGYKVYANRGNSRQDETGAYYAQFVESGHETGKLKSKYKNIREYEYGSIFVPPQPFFWPTVQNMRQQMINKVVSVANKKIKEVE